METAILNQEDLKERDSVEVDGMTEKEIKVQDDTEAIGRRDNRVGYPSPRQTRSEPVFAGFGSEGYDYGCLGNGSTMSGMSGYGAPPNLATTAGLFYYDLWPLLVFVHSSPHFPHPEKSNSRKTLVNLIKM